MSYDLLSKSNKPSLSAASVLFSNLGNEARIESIILKYAARSLFSISAPSSCSGVDGILALRYYRHYKLVRLAA
jgi:hypothetical protein